MTRTQPVDNTLESALLDNLQHEMKLPVSYMRDVVRSLPAELIRDGNSPYAQLVRKYTQNEHVQSAINLQREDINFHIKAWYAAFVEYGYKQSYTPTRIAA